MNTINEDKRSQEIDSSRSSPVPAPVLRALKKLGQDLALARRRRRITQESMAMRVQTSVATLRRMEKGDPRIAFGTIAQVLFVLGELDKVTGLLDTAVDDIGLALMNQHVPKRVRAKRVKPESGAL